MNLLNEDTVKLRFMRSFILREFKEGQTNTGEKWEKDKVYGKAGVYWMLSYNWIPVLIFGILLVYTIIHFEDILFTVTDVQYSSYIYLAIKVALSTILLMDFCIRTKKFYFAMIWNVTATKLCKYFIVMNYVLLFGLLYEPFVWLFIWGWSVMLILREMGALVPMCLIVYAINEIFIYISFQKHEVEFNMHEKKVKESMTAKALDDK